MDDEPETEEVTTEPEEPRSSGWNWWLITIPTLAVITFVVVLLFGANTLQATDLHTDAELWHVVLVGSVIFVILLIVEISLLWGAHPAHLEDEAEPAPGPETPAAREERPAEAEEAEDLEILETDDQVEGRQVLEVARPPKGSVDAGVYATTYVPVDGTHVLRLEEIVALRS